MFKTKEEVIVIQAEATDPITTGVVFWSHDKGTAKLLFQLEKGIVSQTLAEGTIVPICLDFTGGRHIYHAVIEDAVNGIVSIVLEDNILGYQGRVDGSIYIELPDSRSLDTAGRFTFDIKRSPIDENVPELEDYYWQGFGEIMNQYHQTIAEIETESERLLNKLQARILTLEEKLDNVELRARFKTAWSWSADGTDRFTKVYPRENLWNQSKSKPGNISIRGETVTATAHQWYCEDYIEVAGDRLIRQTWNPNKVVNTVSVARSAFYDSDKVFISAIEYPLTQKEYYAGNIPVPQNAKYFRFNIINGNIGIVDPEIKWKFEFGNTPTIYTPSPIDDPINAYPTYKGISIVDSDNPADYSWQAEDNTIAKKTDLTKDKVGLENVDNYSTATQAEAEAGMATNKFMTPATTAQAIDNRAVTLASNQTIGGIKNFQDGLMVGGDLAVSKNDHSVFILDSTTSSVIADGKLYFILHGSLVVVEGSIKFKTGVAYLAMISSSLPNSMIATINNGILVGSAGNDSAKGIFVENGTKNIKASSVFVPNEWFTCNGVYWAGKE